MTTQIIIDHIRTATPKSRLNRRRTSSKIATGLAALGVVAAILAVAYIASK